MRLTNRGISLSLAARSRHDTAMEIETAAGADSSGLGTLKLRAAEATGRKRARRHTLKNTILAVAVSLGATACCLRVPPSQEFGHYALGMTYAEVLAVNRDLSTGSKPPWPLWPPTAVAVLPPPGVKNMRLVFTGECLTAIEAIYFGSCEDGLTQRLARRYGPPISVTDEAHAWSDGVRDVVVTTQNGHRPDCKLTCVPTCALRYSFSRVALPTGLGSTVQGVATCRAMSRRVETRFRVDPLHTFQRHALDELGYLLKAD